MENLRQQNQKEELNIVEQISQYKNFIGSLREKYSDVLDASYRLGGNVPEVDSAPTKPDRINWQIESEDFKVLSEIKNFILNSSKGDLNNKAVLYPFRSGEEGLGSHQLDWWLNAYDKGLDFITSSENIVD